jgi:hypothetical protein
VKRASSSAKALSRLPVPALCAYIFFGAASWYVYDLVADRKWSSMMTMSAVAHCFGLLLLCIQVFSTRTAAGISARALVLDGLAVSLRLSSTLFFEGYLPNDSSGDHVYQCFDICSLLLIATLLRAILITYRSSYEEFEDDIRVGPFVIIALVLGALLHGDMDDHPVFDTFWLSSLLLSVVATLPQYWMISKSCGRAHVLTAHYIAASAVDRALSGLFMWYVRAHITCVPWFGEFQHTICTILVAHLIHVLLLSDFAFYYLRALLSGRPIGGSVTLRPQADTI